MTGHAESAEVTFDPAKISYEKLLEVFWHNIDPDAVGRPVLRSRLAVPLRDLLPERRAEAGGRGLEGEARAGPAVPREDRDADRAGLEVLSGRGAPPELLQGQSAPLQDVRRGLRPRGASQGDLGRRRREPPVTRAMLGALAAVLVLGATLAATLAPSPRSDAGCPRDLDAALDRDGRFQKPSDDGAPKAPDAAPVRRHPAGGHGARVFQRVLGQQAGRHLRRHRLGRAALLLAREVRLGDRLAELLEAARAGEHQDGRGALA